jgi:hypothetical protein
MTGDKFQVYDQLSALHEQDIRRLDCQHFCHIFPDPGWYQNNRNSISGVENYMRKDPLTGLSRFNINHSAYESSQNAQSTSRLCASSRVRISRLSNLDYRQTMTMMLAGKTNNLRKIFTPVPSPLPALNGQMVSSTFWRSSGRSCTSNHLLSLPGSRRAGFTDAADAHRHGPAAGGSRGGILQGPTPFPAHADERRLRLIVGVAEVDIDAIGEPPLHYPCTVRDSELLLNYC